MHAPDSVILKTQNKLQSIGRRGKGKGALQEEAPDGCERNKHRSEDLPYAFCRDFRAASRQCRICRRREEIRRG